jgi:hypothetical protein
VIHILFEKDESKNQPMIGLCHCGSRVEFFNRYGEQCKQCGSEYNRKGREKVSQNYSGQLASYEVTRKFTGGVLEGLSHTDKISFPMEVGFSCKDPIGGSPYVITECKETTVENKTTIAAIHRKITLVDGTKVQATITFDKSRGKPIAKAGKDVYVISHHDENNQSIWARL